MNRKPITYIAATLALLTAACRLDAQTIQFYYHGQPVPDGTTVSINAETDIWGELACATNPVGDTVEGLVLRNLSDSSVSGTAVLTLHKGTMQPDGITWCMGSLCVPISTDSYTKEITIEPASSILAQLDAVPQALGEMTARIAATANDETTTVFVRFVNPDPAQPLQFMRRSVIEEYTGTWCDNCPRGTVGTHRLKEDFGDRCIVIHPHVGASDPMTLSAYNEMPAAGAVPSSTIDRGSVLNPYAGSGTHGSYHYGIDIDFAERLHQPTEAGVGLVAEWDEMERDVVLTTTTTFNINSATAPYRLMLLLLEDGLSGTGRAWAQANAFSVEAGSARMTGYNDEDMQYWTQAPYYVTGLSFDEVPVNTKGIKDGIDGSVAAPIVSGEPQTYTDRITTFRQNVIQNKNHLYAVAMLINTETGRIVNAATSPIHENGYSAIYTPADDAQDLRRATTPIYDLSGRPVGKRLSTDGTQLPRGIYIHNGHKYIITR